MYVPGGIGKVGMRLANKLPPVETWGKAYDKGARRETRSAYRTQEQACSQTENQK